MPLRPARCVSIYPLLFTQNGIPGRWVHGWDQQVHPRKKNKDGTVYSALTLDGGQTYEFRNFLDQERWENDWSADAYSPNEMGTEKSVIED